MASDSDPLSALVDDESPDVRASLLGNSSVPMLLLNRFETDSRRIIRCAIGGNTSTPSEILRRLASDEVRMVREAVAANPSTPLECLRVLAADAKPAVREACATNPHLNEYLLTLLSVDDATAVHVAVAKHSNAPREALAVLAKTESSLDVIEALASNPACPSELLKSLARRGYIGGGGGRIRQVIARNPATPVELLAEWCKSHRDVLVRASVATNPVIPSELLERLQFDTDDAVRRAVAENPSVSPAILDRLADDPDWVVQEAVALNSGSAKGTLERLSRVDDSRIHAALASNPAFDPVGAVRLGLKVAEGDLVVGKEMLARSVLELRQVREALANDSDPWVRTAIAASTATPSDLVKILVFDPDDNVRAAAASNETAVGEWVAIYGEGPFMRKSSPERIALQVSPESTQTPRAHIPLEGADPWMWLSPSGRWLCVRTVTGGDGLVSVVDTDELKVVATFSLSDTYYDEYPLDVKWSSDELLMSVVECSFEAMAGEDDVPVLVVSMITMSTVMNGSVPLADPMQYGVAMALGARFDKFGERVAIDFAVPNPGGESDAPFGLAVVDLNQQREMFTFNWAPPGAQAVLNADMTCCYLTVDPSFMSEPGSSLQLWMCFVDDSTYTVIDLGAAASNRVDAGQLPEFDPYLYGMDPAFDEAGRYVGPEGFNPETGEWRDGSEAQRIVWEKQYEDAYARWEAEQSQASSASGIEQVGAYGLGEGSVDGAPWLSADEKTLYLALAGTDLVLEIDIDRGEVLSQRPRSEVEPPIVELWSLAARNDGAKSCASRDGQWVYEYDGTVSALIVRSSAAQVLDDKSLTTVEDPLSDGFRRRVALELPDYR